MLLSLSEQITHFFLRCWIFLSFWFFPPLKAQVSPTEGSTNPIIVASYNVDNYLMMPRWINGHYRSNAGKPATEKIAVTKVIAGIHPDIIGFMEVGDDHQFHDLQHHLQQAGLTYPYSEYLQGVDQQRHIALLSRFPIVERHSQSLIPLWVEHKNFFSPRGILDVTIEVQPDYQLRILCIHLKSKIFVSEYNQSLFREAEAAYLRGYIENILAKNPKTNLLVMGDFNDTKNSKPVTTILGKVDETDALSALSLKDEREETWTEYWKYADEYSRIDYILVNKNLAPSIVNDHSGIARPPFWNEASDHCALFTEIISKKN